jgi:hypothetical protein
MPTAAELHGKDKAPTADITVLVRVLGDIISISWLPGWCGIGSFPGFNRLPESWVVHDAAVGASVSRGMPSGYMIVVLPAGLTIQAKV